MSSPAILLTGATGLLGRYILRRLLQAGHDVAVIVRPSTQSAISESKAESVRRRIEQVLQPFESSRLLPRPRVIAWDFAESSAGTTLAGSSSPSSSGVSAEDHQWLSERHLSVVHCAASIRFQEDRHSGEPYRTNVSGTQNVLEMCKRHAIAAFHHVSTAYVGDHRGGQTVMESPVSWASTGGNDYEKSKIQAEQLVMNQMVGKPLVIHRPSIVVGDSLTSFTSTFHGFYAPLQIGWQYAKLFGFSDQAGQWFRQQLGLNPTDRKNLVSVDWVAEGIVQTIEKQAAKELDSPAGQPLVLHWTNPQPVACQVMQSAIVDAIERGTRGLASASDASVSTKSPFIAAEANVPSPEQFREQMQVYESYFQSDPNFDRQNAVRVACNLICPEVNYELLSKLSDWAVQANFGWPKPPLPELKDQRIVEAIRQFRWLENPSGCTIVRVQLLGPGSPETICFGISPDQCGRVVEYPTCDQFWRVSLQSLKDCITGTTQLSDIIGQGYWLIEGNRGGMALDCAKIWINHIGMILK